jgi:hypothetical protein
MTELFPAIIDGYRHQPVRGPCGAGADRRRQRVRLTNPHTGEVNDGQIREDIQDTVVPRP